MDKNIVEKSSRKYLERDDLLNSIQIDLEKMLFLVNHFNSEYHFEEGLSLIHFSNAGLEHVNDEVKWILNYSKVATIIDILSDYCILNYKKIESLQERKF